MKAPEGPHLFHVGDWWYLLIAEGGTERGHCVSVARSQRPDGGFEPCPHNPILTHRSTDHPVQSVGHADLVEWDGRWWGCYHGTRPHGQSPEFHVIGRETMVYPIDWVDGWPVFCEDAAHTHTVDTSLAETFTGPLGPRWVSPQGDLSNAALSLEGLVLRAGRPLVIRVQDHAWDARARLDVRGGTGRLLIHLDDQHWVAVEADARQARALGRSDPFEQVFGTAEVPDPGDVTLWVRARVPAQQIGMAAGPDVVTLGLSSAQGDVELAALDGRHLSTEVAGGFTGRTVGVQCTDGTLVVRAFDYRRLEAPLSGE